MWRRTHATSGEGDYEVYQATRAAPSVFDANDLLVVVLTYEGSF